MDPLSDVLSLLKPRSYTFGGFDAGAEWSIHFGRHEGIKCYAVVSGACWLSVEGVADAVRLMTGDCFLLPRGWPFRVASDLASARTGSRDGGDSDELRPPPEAWARFCLAESSVLMGAD